MKYIITLLITLVHFYNYAQQPVLTLQDQGFRNIDNAYYKDNNNELDSFEGTWLFTDGNNSLKIVLEKEVMYYNGSYYEDRIRGEYQYIKNGVEIVNTLIRLNDTILQPSFSRHEIYGNSILRDCFYIPLNDCNTGELRLRVSFMDPNSNEHYGEMILKHRVINGQDALKAYIGFGLTNPSGPADRVISDPDLPWQGEYVMFKQ
ncbi:hypothetical protein BST92_05515 [Nonlabens arenilitoris]|uniref:DUF6705 domain-containing protein n=1 Tax=Nonlabens arenilitoris TaxID=1217969 RepID=A0A2S7U9Z2_9FLAO|nr:DUF6705 family protein [Nonlabens arenilitoris]PQJ31411.1 hypothetical protein BST92_05515 [Nonlabens arenilitoris]